MSFKLRGSLGLMVMCYGYHCSGSRFDSHLANFRFVFFFTFFRLKCQVRVNPLTTTRSNILAHLFLAINCQPLELESCSNPLRIQQVFQLTSEKNVCCFGFQVFWVERHKQGCFCVILAIFAWPWVLSQWAIFWTQSLVENYVKICVYRALD